ncbi:hypothetical protein ACLOJK_002014 [Asimina triloba]
MDIAGHLPKVKSHEESLFTDQTKVDRVLAQCHACEFSPWRGEAPSLVNRDGGEKGGSRHRANRARCPRTFYVLTGGRSCQGVSRLHVRRKIQPAKKKNGRSPFFAIPPDSLKGNYGKRIPKCAPKPFLHSSSFFIPFSDASFRFYPARAINRFLSGDLTEGEKGDSLPFDSCPF